MNHHPPLATSAAAAEEDKDDVGTCSVCFLAFSASEADRVPRLLKCGHSFCTACLSHLLASPTPTPTANSEAELEEATWPLRCPKCRTETRVLLVDGEVAAGVKGLPRNFDLIDLLSSALRQPRPTGETCAMAALKCANCSQPAAEKFCEQCGGAHLCVSCDHQIHAFPALRSHRRVASTDAPHAPGPSTCERHRGKKAKMWCEHDGVAVCTMCLIVGPHKGHDAVTIEEAVERVREAALVDLAQVEAAMGEVEAAVERQAAHEAGEQESAREARAAIKQHFDRMREAVAQRERALGAELDEWEHTRAEAAAKRRAELAGAQTRLAAAGKALQQQLQLQHGGLGRSATSSDSAPCQEARTAAAAVTGTQASSSSIAFTSEDTWVQVVGSSGRLERRVAATDAGGVVRDYAAMTAAQRTFGSGAQLRCPWGVAVDAATGHIVVADFDGRRVHVWRSDDGSCVRSFLNHGSGPAQFRCPRGVAVDEEGHIIVADCFNHRVQVWRANDGTCLRIFGSEGNNRVHVWRTDGSFICTFGSAGRGYGQFMNPMGVAVDTTTGYVVVADYGNHRVQFNGPAGVAVDAATGNIIVADSSNKRVQVW
ncbi:Bbox zinc finger domain containing protein [Acanthamoeba castellanii str. Neff]|uniref:Bbox zinc finger domain containing protein n=1 Tax=Acanthamoeba castellanii (strain ATCC 30010 / Neff) TaxID=1257118 RepID=L8GUM0_ACACF|nr:Bbox zinc finger domain containing protein [Acanthamoeba castellanii str. Neff]ELR15801.1 Bbox zinc finger domain containing protein [Acanthamoeba castellanii str. Neff]